MIQADQRDAALHALHRILVIARTMAFERKPHDEIAKVLDVAELLPMLMVRPEDTTEEFRTHLEGLISIDRVFLVALDCFDRVHP
jgi:hypothetical protein